MKKLRKRIFAAVLAAFMIVTAMPATALYASAETGSVSGNAAGQAGTDDTEETGDGDTEETETDDAEEAGDSDTEEPAQEPPAGPSEEDTAECICETLCTEDNGNNSGSINGDCPVCGAEGADLSACKGKEQGSAPEKDTEDDNAGTDTAECICETLCTEDSINGDCPVCGAEDADLSRCKGEKTEEQEKTGEKVITAWEWIDPEEYLTDGMLALPGAGRENPAFAEDVTALLPEKIQAKVAAVNVAEDGEETEEDTETLPQEEGMEITLTGWECASYPEDGAYEGTYTFTASLPEGFVLAEDAAALEVKVELGGAKMLAETVSASYQEAPWNDGVTYTTKTADSCTPVADSSEAVTWNEGWYVVNSTITITEPITVTGAVNLILADGCTLDAQKGIVVTTDNSLTIYAQSGGTGTLNATGTTDNNNSASAGIGGSTDSLNSGSITIHGGVINATGGVANDNYGNPNYGAAGIGGGSPNSGNGGSSGAIKIYGGTVTANSGTGNVTGAGIGGGCGDTGGAGSNITIYGGSVTAASTDTNTGGAGIGGGGGGLTGGGAGSNIQIYGGTVNATGGYLGAGIGGGGAGNGSTSGAGTNITIIGGTVTAVGGQYAAGIGGGGGYYYSGQYGSGGLTGGAGSVTISGGIVDASSPTDVYYADYKGAPIGNGGNAGDTAAIVSKTNAIVFENGAGTVCGDVTFDGSYTVPADYTLNIPVGASLSGSGTLSGGSTFTTENLTADMISVPTDLYYTGKDRTEDLKTRLSDELTEGVTICGQTFTVGGWTLAVEKTGDLTYTATYTNNNDSAKTFTKTITLLKSGTKFEGDVKTYNGDTQATTFNADDTITVKAAPTATGTAPKKAAARLQSDYTAPTAGQMALFVGDVQVSEPVQAGTDGIYTMTVSASEVLLQGNAEPNGNAITLTAKFVGNDNMADAAGTVDVKISAVAMAEKGGTVIGYYGESNLADAFADANFGATVTLLDNITTSTQIDVDTDNLTLDLNGKTYTYTTGSTAFRISFGSLTIKGSGAINASSFYCLAVDEGTLNIESGSFSAADYAVYVMNAGTLQLTGGSFTGGKNAIKYASGDVTEALKNYGGANAPHYAFYDGSSPYAPTGNTLPSGTFTVKECQHKDVTPTANNDGTHTLSCPYCGYTKAAENCDYGEYTHNDTSHTRICKLCGYQNVEAHNIKCTAEASGTVIAVSEACKTCGYGKDLGTVTIHIPKLVYGDLTGVVTVETTLTEHVNVDGGYVNNPSGGIIIYKNYTTISPPSMATLTGDALLSAGTYQIKIGIIIIRDDDNYSADCLLPFTIDPAPLTADMVTLSAESATYSGTEQKPALSVQQGETPLIGGTDYEVIYTRDGVVTNDFTSAGTVKITITGMGNYTGTVTKTFTIGEATPTITWSNTSQELTYTGNPAVITEPTVTLVNNENFKRTISYSYKKEGETAYKDGLPTDAGTYTVKAHVDAAGNYTAADSTNTLTLTINRAQGTLTVPAGPVAKTFGDGQFLLGCSANGDGKISYASSDENVASVSADGNVLIKGAGEAVITVSLADGTNYTGAESQEVRITVAKAAAPAIPGETRNYTYLNGSHGAVTIDVAGKLPKDRGETIYTAATTDGKGILSGVSIDQDGNLVYTVEANKAAGDTAVITVTAVMANYEDTAYAVTIELVEKKTVEPQDGGSVSVKDGCILTYGQTLSDLTLENVIFVEQGTQKQVEGTLAWSDPSHVPEVADRTAQWVFTPKDNKEYEQFTGTAAITVVKATPETEAPEAAAVTYHPAGTLGSVGLNGGGAAWTVGGSAVTVEGTWGWKEPSAIPAVKNSGYTAVFTPEDTANYDKVERTVAVTVAKAEPYIATPPTAAQITYGDALDASALTGGTVQYSSSDSTAVTGSFAWKDGSIKPDSGSAAYTVVFTPADSTDYSSVETQVTLVTGKAENAPDMPPSAMNVARRFEKVGDVGLPEGWQWQDTDRDTALEIGVPVTATAVYTGADRDNYRNVTVSVAITRADCDHEHTETRNAVTATCQRKGYTGDTWCLDCGELLAKGTETDLADHSGGTATCISGKVCQVCGTEYTGKDGANHMHTEIRGAIKAGCTSDGYTGDTYCTDCGAKTGSGRAVPAAGHDWHVTREEAATTTSEGRRIYTCGECGQTREESIPKLPQPSHTHSYSPKETKTATCTENGVVTYSCSCGDSYTQNTAALGHSYRSEVTKQPTVSAEGVMTYTCDRCRHSYTRPIAKLPDTETQQPGTEQPGIQQPGETGPGSGSTETRPDTGIPFIKGEDGKTGWDVIRAEEEKAQEGSTINVDMNGTTVVPGDIFDSIKGKDITITFDMGNGIIWSVDGKSITTDKAGDIDFSVQTGVNTVPVDIVNNVTGERYSIQISLVHEGEFGFKAVLSIGLGRENAGYTASLYYYNESTGELEFICSDEVAEDGTVSLAFTHASDYVIAIDQQQEESGNDTEHAQPEDQDEDSTGQTEESPQTGQAWRPWWLIVVGALVIIMGIGVFFVVRKKQETENS